MTELKTMSTAVDVLWKYLSTRYLSMCIDAAHSTGPEKANTSHMAAMIARTCHSAAVLVRAGRRACWRRSIDRSQAGERCAGGKFHYCPRFPARTPSLDDGAWSANECRDCTSHAVSHAPGDGNEKGAL
jgi:hypothetical protein